MDVKGKISEIRNILNNLESDVVLMYQDVKLSTIRGLKFQIARLVKQLNTAKKSRDQYKSLYEKKSKECLRLQSEIQVLHNRLNSYRNNEA